MRSVARARALIRVLAVGAGLALLATPATAIADEDVTTWAVQPSSAAGPDGRDAFTYTLAPGEAVNDYVGVSNLGTQPLELRIYAMDAVMSADGAFTLPPADTPSTDVGTWVGLNGDGVFTVEPGTRIDVPFRISAPPTASPGDHAGGIVASVVELSGSGDGSQQVSVDRRVGARVYVNVPGEQQASADVSDVSIDYSASPFFTGSPAEVSYSVTNSGNMRIGGTARIAVAGPFGVGLGQSEPIELPEILPGATVELRAGVGDIPPALLLTATVEIEPTVLGGEGTIAGEHSASGTALALPWALLLIILLLLGVVILLWVRGRRLRARLAAAEAAVAQSTRGAEEPVTITESAESHPPEPERTLPRA